MSQEKLKTADLAAELLRYGKARGAAEMEVAIEEGTEFNARVLNQQVENLTQAGSKGVSLRIIVDGKTANASSSDFSKETLEKLVDGAVARARLSGRDSFAGLPDMEKVTAGEAELKIYDPAILDVSPERKIALAKQVEAAGSGEKGVAKSLGGACGTYVSESTLLNSKGFAGSYRKTAIWIGTAYQAGEGQNLFQAGWQDASSNLNELMAPEAVGKKAAARVTRLIGARKVATQNVPVVFEPPMTGQLLDFLVRCLSGAAVDQRQSFLAGKLGEKIGNDRVVIVDDGLLPGGRASAPFDGEGVPARRSSIVEKGVLKSYLLDTYYGRKLKLRSTGNASGPTNFYWAAGDRTPEQILKSVDKGLLLTGTLGQGTVPTTGDISVGAFGLWIEKGEVAYPVAEITISGNMGELLAGVEMVGSDLDFREAVTGPTVKFGSMTVGGKA
ncbi:MAG: TldD/PmbA family protein [Acidobacteriota bacterium]